MSARFFLDSNIVVDSFRSDAIRKAQESNHRIRQAGTTGKGAIRQQLVQEFFKVAFRRFPLPANLPYDEPFLSTVLCPLCVIHSSPALVPNAFQRKDRFHWQW
jgi:predicted nucleic acid-binding protein